MAERITRGPGKGGTGSRPQIRAEPRNIVFTRAKQQAFLAELERTCNVSASARAVGAVEQTVSALRRRNPAFRAAWNAALAEGYVTLELKLMEQALSELDRGEPATDDAAGGEAAGAGEQAPGGGKAGRGAAARAAKPFDPRLALALLKAHRDTVMTERARAGAGQALDLEGASRELDEKLAQMAERMARGEADDADDG